MPTKLIRFIFASIFLVSAFHMDVYATFSIQDKKNKEKIEKEIKSTKSKMREIAGGMKSYTDTEWKAYMKDVKGVGKKRSDKFNTARERFETATDRKQAEVKYGVLKNKYEDMKKKLDQLEYELKELEKKEKG